VKRFKLIPLLIDKIRMPQLVQGHLRFTEEDFVVDDFLDGSKQNYQRHSYIDLVELLNDERLNLFYMRDGEILEHFNTDPNIKRSLTNAIAIIAALAQKRGFNFIDLLRSS